MAKYINKDATLWTVEELQSWAVGESLAGSKVNEASIVAQAVALLAVEPSENIDAVKAAVAATVTPAPAVEPVAPTPTAPAFEEPVQEGVVETGGPVGATTEPEPEDDLLDAPDDLDSEEPTTIEQTPVVRPALTVGDGASLVQVLLAQNLSQYAEHMMPGVPHPQGEGPQAQALLWRTIQSVLRQEGGEFTSAFTILLSFVHEHRKTMFNEYYVFRYFDQLSFSSEERKTFERFLNMLITVADPATRHLGLRQVDLNETLKGFADGNVQQRVAEYFTL